MQDAKELAVKAAEVPGLLQAVHVLGVLAYAGGVITISRMMAPIAALHAEARTGAASVARRAYLLFILPMGVVMVASGLYLLIADPGSQGYLRQPAFHVKLTLVAALMVAEHLMVIRPLKAMAKGTMVPAGTSTHPRAAHALVVLLVAGILLALFVLRRA
jgi:uncharacterized membrane protein